VCKDADVAVPKALATFAVTEALELDVRLALAP